VCFAGTALLAFSTGLLSPGCKACISHISLDCQNISKTRAEVHILKERVGMQESKKRGRSGPGDDSVPGKRARLEGADTSGLGSQNFGADNDEEGRRQSKQAPAKDRLFSFKVMAAAACTQGSKACILFGSDVQCHAYLLCSCSKFKTHQLSALVCKCKCSQHKVPYNCVHLTMGPGVGD